VCNGATPPLPFLQPQRSCGHTHSICITHCSRQWVSSYSDLPRLMCIRADTAASNLAKYAYKSLAQVTTALYSFAHSLVGLDEFA
jgi:hypothetical protein